MTLEMVLDTMPKDWMSSFVLFLVPLGILAGLLAKISVDRSEKNSIFIAGIVVIMLITFASYYYLESKHDKDMAVWLNESLLPYLEQQPTEREFPVEEFVKKGDLYYANYGKFKSVNVSGASRIESAYYDELDIDVDKPENYVVKFKKVQTKEFGGRYYEDGYVISWVFAIGSRVR